MEEPFRVNSITTPIEVKFNKNLTQSCKDLFSYIQALNKKDGLGCFASNSYLAGLVGVTPEKISANITTLIEHGYIIKKLITNEMYGWHERRVLFIDPEYVNKYKYLNHNFNCEYVWKTPEKIQQCDNAFIAGDNGIIASGIHKTFLVTLESEIDKESESLLRKDSLTLCDTSVPDVAKVYSSKLIRKPIEVKPVTQSKLIRRQSTIIKTTPVIQNEEKPVKTELRLSKEVEEIVNEWEDGLKIHDHTTKTFKQAVFYIIKLLNGKMFAKMPQFKDYENRKFTPEEIITSIKNFKLAALSLDYHPVGNLKDNFRKTLFPKFFYNSFSLKYQSLFIEFLNNPPKLVVQNTRLIPDAYPQLSQKLRKLYIENVLGNPNASLLPQSENAFRRAAMKLQNFKDQNKNRILITEVNGNLANYLWEALENKVRNTSDITPNWFCSDKTFQETFPAYLYSQGVLQSLNEREFSIYN
jgi:hypothetical protein